MNDCAASIMGSDNIRYFLFLCGRWRWRPTKAMREAGFKLVTMGRGTVIDGRNVPSLEDKARAITLNEDWDRYRRGLPAQVVEERSYPPGSIGESYLRVMTLRTAERKARGITWTKEQHSRDDWPRAWKWLEPVLADCDPTTITPEIMLELRTLVAERVSETEAHRVIKVWRSLWQKMASFGLCDRDQDPSFLFRNLAPAPRQAVWLEGEAVRLIKRAWREGYHGLAACLAVAWDSQLSPVDARRLRFCDYRRDPVGTWFEVDRAKTGRAALATLSRRTERILQAYIASAAAEPLGTAPVFRNRSGAPYSKDTLGDDFREIRELVFGPIEKRQMADFRRSGSVEALAGEVDPGKLSAKMANTISASNRLHRTYGPVVLANVRDADTARKRGRRRLREQSETKSVIAPVRYDTSKKDR